MAKSSFSLLAFSLTVLTLLLSSGSPALANSIHNNINNLASADSTFTLFGVESNGSISVLSPGFTLHLHSEATPLFASGFPLGWTSGDLTITLSFDNQVIVWNWPSISGGPCPPTSVCAWYYLNGIAVSQKYPATLTFTFGGANGGTSSAQFFIAPAPEPGTMLLFATGGAFLLMLGYRGRRRIVERQPAS
jgi:hypothetical protein